MSRISVNFGEVLQILKDHAAEISEATGILSTNGIIVDAVIDRIIECSKTLTTTEKLKLRTWCPRLGATYRRRAGGA
jgi:hypothetical protein